MIWVVIQGVVHIAWSPHADRTLCGKYKVDGHPILYREPRPPRCIVCATKIKGG